MNNPIYYDADCLIYPGAYVPLMEEKELQEELRRPHEGGTVLPPVNVTELPDSYKIEVAMPGLKREEFQLHIDENILSVCAVHKQRGNRLEESFQLHEFNYECFDRHILLPENADIEFTCAEYKEGILRLYIPKTEKPTKNLHTRIVVY